MKKSEQLVKTVPEKCRMCYTCIRNCPAKAIQVKNGQAEVISERCIGCGNCVKVCSQNAKQYYDSTSDTLKALNNSGKKAAIIAPSFPAAFQDIDYKVLVGMLKKMGFDYVCEVAFGADFVAYEYQKLLSEKPDKSFIATTCPGIVSFVQKYYPKLVNKLAPIASPMVVTARALHKIYGNDLKITFIGPCIAKKEEARRSYSDGKNSEIESVMTFENLSQLFETKKTTSENIEPVDFDPPHPGYGALFPIKGGMLQAADIRINLLTSNILLADGKEDFVNFISEINRGDHKFGLLEILCCKGCIMGAGIKSDASYIKKKMAISDFVNKRVTPKDYKASKELFKKLKKNGLIMNAEFKSENLENPAPKEEDIKKILKKMYKETPQDELNCGACGYHTCREHAAAIYLGLAENEMCLPFTIDKLKKSLDELNKSQEKLGKAKAALFNAEKLASLGELSAGIAHEINNPLGVILLNATYAS